jgi:pyrroloquinoline quinone biosynthesis protein E
LRVFREAASLGVLHLHFNGWNPGSRRLSELIAGRIKSGLYTNLITSGLGFRAIG